MKKNKINIFKIFNPSDSLFILGFVIGLIIAIFFNVMEIRLIGGSVAVLAFLRIVMIFKERAQYQTEKYKPIEQVQFEVTRKKDINANRVVIEDFEEQFEEENSEISQKISFDEKLVSKFANLVSRKETTPQVKKKEEPKEQEFVDEASGDRITVRKIKKDSPNKDIQVEVLNEDQNSSNEPLKNDQNQQTEFYEEILDSELEIQTENDSKEIDESTFEGEIPESQEINQIQSDISETKQTPSLPEKFKQAQIEYDLSLLIESEEIASGEPKKEFEFFIQRILKIIRSVTSTKTATFLLVNHEKNEMVIVACVTDSPEAITKQKKIPITNDVISQIIKNLKPEILSDINPSAELDLIPYYTRSLGTKSLIGVPVFFGNHVAAILCADTNTNDAYDIITASFFGHFTKLISSLMQSYTEKFELVQAEKSLNITKEFRNSILNSKIDASEIFRSAISAISKVLDYSSLGIVAFDEDYERWMIKAITNKKSSDNYTDYSIDTEKSIIKNTIFECKTEIVKIDSNNKIRINPTEPYTEKGYFISVPIKSFKNNFGALYLENRSTSSYNGNDILILEEIADNAGIALEQLVYNQISNSQPLINAETGVLNHYAFYKRLDEEILKANDFNTPLSLFMFNIDKYSSMNNELFRNNYDPIYHHVVNIVNRFIRKYDVFGSIDESTFALVLVGYTLQNANNWARRLRSEIASSAMIFNNKRYSITISGGLAECQKSENFENLIHNTKMVLEIASQKGNNIKTYS